MMKRLVKKSEIYDGFNYRNEYFEVYKNPSLNEIETIKKSDSNNSVRGVIDSNNNVYIWPAEVDHYNINKYVSVPVNHFRFSYEKSYWIFDLTGLGGNLTTDETIEIIKNNKDILQQIGDMNIQFDIVASGPKYLSGKNLNEFLNKDTNKLVKKSKLIKESNYKTLVIVDIQKNFSAFFDEKYLSKVENIINQGWDNIIVVVDNIDGDPQIPSFINNAANKILYKQYGGWEQSLIDEYLDNGEIETIEDDEVYKIGKEYIVRGNIHEFFQIPEDMEMVFKNLQDATIIGGGDQECLDDIESALRYFGVDVKRNSSGIYRAGDKNNDNSWTEEIDWTEV